MTEQLFNEAPASVTVKTISPAGFDILLTIRDAETANLLTRLFSALEWLESKGFKPTTKSASNGNGSANGNAPTCNVHGRKMKRSKHYNGWYCPIKDDDGEYCKQNVKD